MKKLVVLIVGFILGALAMYFYCQKSENMEDPTHGSDEEIMLKGLISPAEIKSLTSAYDDRYDTITKTFFRGVEGGDNRSSWYDLKELRQYLAITEKQAGDIGYTMNGVRLYLGAQPNNGETPGYTTLLFVPTGYENTSEGNVLNLNFQTYNHDIDGLNGLDEGGKGKPPGINYPQ
ncbi:MAG: hypothetical protein WA775_11185 [Psychroserpens sp.]|uniref:hypothetical protein n=1 Tax=Psychroserpens sp. TaxID=2020870 RepID=UPI003C733308